MNSESLPDAVPRTPRTRRRVPRIAFGEVLGTPSVDKRLAVLRSIQDTGSISQAARSNGVSYKAAWQALETLSNLAGVPLVIKLVGGSGGGGARLTPEGLQVLEVAEQLQTLRDQALDQILRGSQATPLNRSALTALGWRTSMRNQLPCIVRHWTRTRGAVRVTLQSADAQTLCARITLESLQLLDLRPGQPVLAMFKATAVTMAPTIVTGAGVNLLQGTVLRRGAGSLGTEIALQMAGGHVVVGFSDPDLALRKRQAAMAAVDENAVVLALTR